LVWFDCDVNVTFQHLSAAREEKQTCLLSNDGEQTHSSQTSGHTLHNNSNSPLHVHLQSTIAQVKLHLVTLYDDACDVRLWIQLLTPTVSFGDNQGIHIQQEVQKYIKKAQVSA